MKSQVLHTVWCNIAGEAAGEIWNWSLLGVKGLTWICVISLNGPTGWTRLAGKRRTVETQYEKWSRWNKHGSDKEKIEEKKKTREYGETIRRKFFGKDRCRSAIFDVDGRVYLQKRGNLKTAKGNISASEDIMRQAVIYQTHLGNPLREWTTIQNYNPGQ